MSEGSFVLSEAELSMLREIAAWPEPLIKQVLRVGLNTVLSGVGNFSTDVMLRAVNGDYSTYTREDLDALDPRYSSSVLNSMLYSDRIYYPFGASGVPFRQSVGIVGGDRHGDLATGVVDLSTDQLEYDLGRAIGNASFVFGADGMVNLEDYFDFEMPYSYLPEGQAVDDVPSSLLLNAIAAYEVGDLMTFNVSLGRIFSQEGENEQSTDTSVPLIFSYSLAEIREHYNERSDMGRWQLVTNAYACHFSRLSQANSEAFQLQIDGFNLDSLHALAEDSYFVASLSDEARAAISSALEARGVSMLNDASVEGAYSLLREPISQDDAWPLLLSKINLLTDAELAEELAGFGDISFSDVNTTYFFDAIMLRIGDDPELFSQAFGDVLRPDESYELFLYRMHGMSEDDLLSRLQSDDFDAALMTKSNFGALFQETNIIHDYADWFLVGKFSSLVWSIPGILEVALNNSDSKQVQTLLFTGDNGGVWDSLVDNSRSFESAQVIETVLSYAEEQGFSDLLLDGVLLPDENPVLFRAKLDAMAQEGIADIALGFDVGMLGFENLVTLISRVDFLADGYDADSVPPSLIHAENCLREELLRRLYPEGPCASRDASDRTISSEKLRVHYHDAYIFNSVVKQLQDYLNDEPSETLPYFNYQIQGKYSSLEGEWSVDGIMYLGEVSSNYVCPDPSSSSSSSRAAYKG